MCLNVNQKANNYQPMKFYVFTFGSVLIPRIMKSPPILPPPLLTQAHVRGDPLSATTERRASLSGRCATNTTIVLTGRTSTQSLVVSEIDGIHYHRCDNKSLVPGMLYGGRSLNYDMLKKAEKIHTIYRNCSKRRDS